MVSRVQKYLRHLMSFPNALSNRPKIMMSCKLLKYYPLLRKYV